MWIYAYSNWLVCTVIVVAIVAVALIGHRLWRRLFAMECSPENSALAMGMMVVVGVVLSLLLAFSSASVWEAFRNADASVATEASKSGELVRDLSIYGGPAANATREAVRDYLKSIIADEWPAMAKGGHAEKTSHKFNDIFHRAAALDPHTVREQVLFSEILQKANVLNEHRRGRLNAAASSAAPDSLWGIIIVGILINFFLFYILPISRVNDLLIGVYAAMLGLMLFFIIAMNHPFTGAVSVSDDPYKAALQSMERWDAETLALPGSPVSGSSAPPTPER